MSGIAVILGAGASYDCADADISRLDGDWSPPLVNELFSNRVAFHKVLQDFPKAAALAPRIRDQVSSGQPLEEVLQHLAASRSPAVRSQFLEVPLYLNDLIGGVSDRFVGHAGTRFSTLVSLLDESTFDNIVYITVNYDTFMERALKALYGVAFGSLADYVAHSRWGLFKLHGSAGWGRKISNGRLLDRDPGAAAAGVIALSPGQTELRLDDNIRVMFGQSHRTVLGGDYYPVLSVPIGGKEQFACPAEHLEEMDRRLADCTTLLVVGFSCLDTHVVKKLTALPHTRNLRFVGGGLAEERKMLYRLQQATKRFDCFAEDVSANCGFREFVRSGRLANLCGL